MSSTYLDFETRCRPNVGKVGADRYSRDESLALLCMAHAKDDGPVELWLPGQPFPAVLREAIEAGVMVVAHNAAFERSIWNNYCVPRLGWPAIRFRQWWCTASQAVAAGLPRGLGALAQVLRLDDHKDSDGHKLMLKYTKPRKPTATDPSEWYDDPRELAKIYEYCRTDVAVERLTHRAMPSMSTFERATYLLDQKINDRGIPVDVDLCLRIDSQLRAYHKRLNGELTTLTNGAFVAATQRDQMLNWFLQQGLNIDNVRADTIRQIREDSTLSPHVRRVAMVRDEVSRTSNAKFASVVKCCCADRRVRGVHLYHGAHTGRWTGKLVQTQNIPRGMMGEPEIEPAIDAATRGDFDIIEFIYGNVSEAMSGLIRPVIKATNGKRLIVCDFAAIEARVLAWLAGEMKLVQEFRAGVDVYESLASRIYGVPIDRVTKAQRQMGKQAILGLGYGMGAQTFIATCGKYRIAIDEEFAQNVVTLYRETYPAIRAFWYACDDAAKSAVRKQQTETVGRIRYTYDGRYLRCRLPSGRAIHYFEPEIEVRKKWGDKLVPCLFFRGTHPIRKTWERLETYGGKLVENIVQAVARDLLVEAMFRLERAGYPIIMHVHDEVVIELEIGRGSLKEVKQIMATPPGWAMTCPIGVEGFEAQRYRK